MQHDLGLLFLRVPAGLMLAFGHGLGKMQSVFAGKLEFADPLGLGAGPSLVLVAFAEFVCALAVSLGIKTRWAAVPVAVTMLVAGFVQHAADPWRTKELAMAFAVIFVTLAITGGGRYAVDSLWGKKR